MPAHLIPAHTLRRLVSLICVSLLILGACTEVPAQQVREATLVLAGPVFDSVSGEVIEEGIVVISGDSVACSGARGECEWPAEVPVRTFDEGTILPGLIDLHVHARPHYLGAFLPSGVTTIRDANNTLAVIDELHSLDQRPRIFASGPLLDAPGSSIAQMSTTDGFIGDHPLTEIMPVYVEEPAGASEAVEALADAGVDLVKLYALLDLESFEAAVAAARARDVPVAADLGMIFTQGLAGAEVDIVQAAEAGVTSIEHVSGLSLAYQRRGGDPMADEPDGAILDAIADELMATDAALVPTLANLVQFSDPGALRVEGLPGAELLQPYFQEHWDQLTGWAEQAHDQFAAGRRLKRALLLRLHERGMLIGAGSDLPAAPYMLPGAALHQELEALVVAGLSPAEALQAATSNAAAILGQENIGHLGAGAQADVLVVKGDPTRDILTTRNVMAVWIGGNEVDIPAAWDTVESQMRAAISNTPR